MIRLTDEEVIAIRKKSTPSTYGAWADTKTFAKNLMDALEEKNLLVEQSVIDTDKNFD